MKANTTLCGYWSQLNTPLRQNPKRPFFLPPAKGPQAAPKSDPLREEIVALRKRNLSIYDISRALRKEGHAISPVSVSIVLKAEGFARLPRRRDEERLSQEIATAYPRRAGPLSRAYRAASCK